MIKKMEAVVTEVIRKPSLASHMWVLNRGYIELTRKGNQDPLRILNVERRKYHDLVWICR